MKQTSILTHKPKETQLNIQNKRHQSPFAGFKSLALKNRQLETPQPIPRRCLDFRKSPAEAPKRQDNHLQCLARTRTFAQGRQGWSMGRQPTCPSFEERKVGLEQIFLTR